MNYWSASAFLVLLFVGNASALTATGADSRVDLSWEAKRDVLYNVYRNDAARGSFEKINKNPHPVGVYSDFTGKNGRVYYYKVSEIVGEGKERFIAPKPVSARTRQMEDAELVTSIQEATFRYFWDYAHPVSGMTRERYFGNFDGCASGGTGFGVLAVMIGAERGFVTRTEAAERLLTIAKFLEKADRYHGAWAHWINGSTGKTIRFSKTDDGADIVETALLMQGLLTVRQYFDQDNPVEKELRETITRLWETVEWDWFYKEPYMVWHWSPNYGFEKNLKVRGYNECMIVYLLAIASPTHPIPAEAYYEGWAGQPNYANGKKHYGITLDVGRHMGGPLFLSHYSFCCFDPRGIREVIRMDRS